MARPPRFALGLALLALACYSAGGGGRVALAIFTDQETQAASFATAACFSPDDDAPTVTATAVATTATGVPGTIRAGASYRVYANVTDGGCAPTGVATVTADVSAITAGGTAVALAAGSWTVGGVAFGWASAAVAADAGVPEGDRMYSVTATDGAGNPGTASGLTVGVDNTAPSAADIQTANGGSAAGRPEAGDTITLTTSEPIHAGSILAGWTGGSTDVVVRINNGTLVLGDRLTVRNAANTAQLPLGSVDLGTLDLVTTDIDFGASGTPSTMVMSGSAITITLGTPSTATGMQVLAGTMTWTPDAAATDRAGNPASTAAGTESGPADREF